MLSRFRKVEGEKGFTWVELLIVIAIIGILAAIAIPQFSTYKDRGYDLDSKASLHNLYRSCTAYWADNGGSADCTAASVIASYGYIDSADITTTITTGSEKGFVATAVNGKGGNSAGYGIVTGGTITKN